MRGMLHALHAANHATDTLQMHTDSSADSRPLTSPDVNDEASPSPSQVLVLSLAMDLDARYSLRNKMIDSFSLCRS